MFIGGAASRVLEVDLGRAAVLIIVWWCGVVHRVRLRRGWPSHHRQQDAPQPRMSVDRIRTCRNTRAPSSRRRDKRRQRRALGDAGPRRAFIITDTLIVQVSPWRRDRVPALPVNRRQERENRQPSVSLQTRQGRPLVGGTVTTSGGPASICAPPKRSPIDRVACS